MQDIGRFLGPVRTVARFLANVATDGRVPATTDSPYEKIWQGMWTEGKQVVEAQNGQALIIEEAERLQRAGDGSAVVLESREETGEYRLFLLFGPDRSNGRVVQGKGIQLHAAGLGVGVSYTDRTFNWHSLETRYPYDKDPRSLEELRAKPLAEKIALAKIHALQANVYVENGNVHIGSALPVPTRQIYPAIAAKKR